MISLYFIFSYVAANLWWRDCLGDMESFLGILIPNMLGFHWTKVVWAAAILHLALCKLLYVLQYVVIDTIIAYKQLIPCFYCIFSSLSTNTTGVATAVTMAAAGGNGPLAPHMRPCSSCWCVQSMGKTPQASRHNFWDVEGVYGPWNTPMLWQFIIATI